MPSRVCLSNFNTVHKVSLKDTLIVPLEVIELFLFRKKQRGLIELFNKGKTTPCNKALNNTLSHASRDF